jgi:hypothetical protein
MDLMSNAQDWWNGDDGEKRREEELRQMRMARAKEDRLRGLAASSGFGYAGPNPSMLASQHFGQQVGAVQSVNRAISDEMDSRVAQAREARRMAHEQELMRMRMQLEREKAEAMLRRLDQEQNRLPPGVISRMHIDGRGRMTRQ